MIRGNKISLSAEIPALAICWRNNYETWRWCRQYTLLSVEDHNAWLARIATDKTIKMFGIFNEYEVGVCGLTSIDRLNQSAEFSLYIAPDFRKKGYAKDALQTLCKHGFEDHNLNRIWGEVFDGNPALGMFEKLGFQREGTLKQAYFRNGKFIDAHRIALLRENFCA